MMKPGLCGLLLTLTAAALAGGEGKLVYAVDFNAPEVKAAVKATPYASVVKDFENQDCLVIDYPADVKEPGGDDLPGAVKLPLDIKKMDAKDKRLFIECQMRFSNVAQPPKKWLGVKFMINYNDHGKDQWQQWDKKYYGTMDWAKAAFSTFSVSSDRATLYLGLQGASGKIEFKTIRVYAGGAGDTSVLDMTEIPRAQYTYQPPRGRGVMSPFPGQLNESDFEELERWHANLMRYQLCPPGEIRGSKTATKAWLETQKKTLPAILDMAKRHGIMVVVDLHYRGYYTSAEGRDYMKSFWRDVVSMCKGHPALWGYDIMNEPDSRKDLAIDAPRWQDILEEQIKSIREVDPVTPVIVEPDQMANETQLEYLPIFKYPNIIYSIHFYTPGAITHQGVNGPMPQTKVSYPGGEWNKEWLRKQLARVREYQLKTGARIYVGEFSVIRWTPGGEQWLKDSIEIFEEYGWDWTYHAFREWDGWSVEHEGPSPGEVKPSADNPRKQVLLHGLLFNLK